MLNRFLSNYSFFFLAVILSVTFFSCATDDECIAVIIVKDFQNNTISGAEVTLHQDSIISDLGYWSNESNLRKTEETDANGRAEFSYPLEAILNIEVIHITGNDTLTGKNVIRLLQGKTETQLVTID